MPVPQELQVAAEIALSNRCLTTIKALEQEASDSQLQLSYLAELETTATEANHLQCNLNIPQGKPALEKLIWRSLWQLLYKTNPETLEEDIHYIERLIDVGNQLKLTLSLDRCQELYFSRLHSSIKPQCQLTIRAHKILASNDGTDNDESPSLTDWNTNSLRQLLQLGEKLAVDVSTCLSLLP